MDEDLKNAALEVVVEHADSENQEPMEEVKGNHKSSAKVKDVSVHGDLNITNNINVSPKDTAANITDTQLLSIAEFICRIRRIAN